MSNSFGFFILVLVLADQLRRHARNNGLPEWEKRFRMAMILSVVLFLASSADLLSGFMKWFWYAGLAILMVLPYRMKVMQPLRTLVLAFIPYLAVSFVSDTVSLISRDFYNSWVNFFSTAQLLSFIWLVAILFSYFRQRKAAEKERIKRLHEEELNRATAIRKAELETLVEERTAELTAQKQELEKALDELRATQSQLIHAEKMASLGELTAGVAHEMQNPLNFVNNFSEVSIELVDEMQSELEKGSHGNALAVAGELRENLRKIAHHGKSADAVVKGMLLHSRKAPGEKMAADINALADEYLRLSYFSLRAKDKTFQATLKTDFDKSLSADKDGNGKINVNPQEMGRAILNLINNAFYAVREKKKLNLPGYEPTVTVGTRKKGNMVEIQVKDNGIGIPSHILPKIYQPFFTTKPTGEGTGLGLSLSYDVVTKVHGGELNVETQEGESTAFTIRIPV